MKLINFTIILILCFSSVAVKAQIYWDFEDGNDHGFKLWSVVPATPADEDDNIAGDEAITGVGGENGLPAAGIAWSIGEPNQFDGLTPAFEEGCHVVEGVLQYGDCNDPFGATVGQQPPYDFTNSRGQKSYLNTYDLSQWGDGLHVAANDQIATSPVVLLSAGATLNVWSHGGGGATFAPAPEADRKDGYVDGSSGIAVLSAADSSFLVSVFTQNQGTLGENTLDLSTYAGQHVIIEVVDAFEGSWGWLAIDEIEISHATITGIEDKSLTIPAQFELAQNYPNPFNPTTKISYSLGKNTRVELNVYNIHGQNVATLVNQYQRAGNYDVVWDASKASAGVYFYKMKVDNDVLSKRMILIK